MATKNEKYSAAQRNAYLRGQGFQQAKTGNRVECKTEAEKKSFREGINSAKKWGKKK